MTWKRTTEADELRALLGPDAQIWRKGEWKAIVSRDRLPGEAVLWNGRPRWHISISGADRVPPWEQIVDAAHELRPGVVFVVGVPPRSWWINVHPHTLHLWELRDHVLAEQWEAERMGMVPT